MDVDYIIVGGGLAGCVLASRLHEKEFSCKIVLIESGPDRHGDPKVMDPSATFLLHGTDYHYNYKTAPQKHLDGRSVPTTGGKLLSGSSCVNNGTWTRGAIAGKIH